MGRPSPRPTALTCSVRTGLCPPVPPARFAFALSAPPSPTCRGPPAPACSPQLTCFAGAAHLAAPAGQVQRPRMARPGQEGSTGRGHPLCPLCASPERRWREKGEGRVPWGARGLTLPAPGGQCRPPTILSAPPHGAPGAGAADRGERSCVGAHRAAGGRAGPSTVRDHQREPAGGERAAPAQTVAAGAAARRQGQLRGEAFVPPQEHGQWVFVLLAQGGCCWPGWVSGDGGGGGG